jgi:hypothetical protein
MTMKKLKVRIMILSPLNKKLSMNFLNKKEEKGKNSNVNRKNRENSTEKEVIWVLMMKILNSFKIARSVD